MRINVWLAHRQFSLLRSIAQNSRLQFFSRSFLSAPRLLLPSNRGKTLKVIAGTVSGISSSFRSALGRQILVLRGVMATLGVRTLDSLHVACALELKAERFWTFDERQARLAEAVGLNTNP